MASRSLRQAQGPSARSSRVLSGRGISRSAPSAQLAGCEAIEIEARQEVKTYNLTVFLVTLLVSAPITATADPYWFSTLAGSTNADAVDGTNGEARFFQPEGIVMDADGILYVGDMRNNLIRKIRLQGQDYVVTTIAGATNSGSRVDGTNSSARFSEPQGLALDGSGNLYVADSLNNAVRKIARVGTNWVTTTLATGLNYPNSIALDSGGSVYVTDSDSQTIRRLTFSVNHWVVSTIAGLLRVSGTADGTNGNARFNHPNGIAIDSQTNIFVTDTSNYAIRQITPVGTDWVVTTIAGVAGVAGGTVDGTNDTARFSPPLGITLDSVGNLYVSEVLAIRKLVHSGTNWIVTTLSGSFGKFFEANALISDSTGRLYVVDAGHNLIRVGGPAFSLGLQQAENNIAVFWTTSASNYVLETRSNWADSFWKPVTNVPSASGNSYWVTNEITSGMGFYRLRMQWP